MKLDELRRKAQDGEFKDTRPRSDPPPAMEPESLWLRYHEHDDHFTVTADGSLKLWTFEHVQKSILDFAKGWAGWPASTTLDIEPQATPPYGHLTAMYSYPNGHGGETGHTTTFPVGFDFAEEDTKVRIPKFRCESCAGADKLGGEPGACLVCGREMLV